MNRTARSGNFDFAGFRFVEINRPGKLDHGFRSPETAAIAGRRTDESLRTKDLMPEPGRKTISQIRAEARRGVLEARVHAQIEEIARRDASNGKPFWEIRLRDAADAMTLKAWSDSANFAACEEFEPEMAVEVEGEFSLTGFGLDARRWVLRPLSADEASELFEGDDSLRASLQADFERISQRVSDFSDPRLKALGEAFLGEFGSRFRRAAAARHNHHAFRGGLLRHTAQMMLSADALCAAYPGLNRDLLLAGVLVHDCGKLWEMCPAEGAFVIQRELRGELLGHISIGIEVVNALWRKLPHETWKTAVPLSEEVRLHLLHLIASHHGELQFGSPVEPKTPEAIALHFLDNLDARLEMIWSSYERQTEIAPGILERVRALNVSPVRSLPRFPSPEK
jgi:3'-5' exoribonuclease